MKRTPLSTVLFVGALALVGTVALTGCQGGSDASTASSNTEDRSAGSAGDFSAEGPEPATGAPAPGPVEDAAGSPADGGTAGGGTAAGLGAVGLEAVGRGRVAPGAAVIRTGDLEVVVIDVRKASDEAARLIANVGGLVESEERSDAGDYAVATLQLRVPPEAFDATVGRLAALGEERSRRFGRQDVTDQVVDLESRLSSQQASVDRVRALLGQADNLGEVVQVEAELTRRTADLESLQARLAALTTQVDLSTVTLHLLTQDSEPSPADAGPLGFRDGLRDGWAAVVAIGHGVGRAAGALLPFSPLLLGAGFLLWRARRHPGVAQTGAP